MLARLFYLDKYGEFCVRELLQLKKYSDLESIDRLIESFGNFAHSFTSKPSKSAEKKELPAAAKSKVEQVGEKPEKKAFAATSGAFGAVVGEPIVAAKTESEELAIEDDDDWIDSDVEEEEVLEEEVMAEVDFNTGFFDVLDSLEEED